jgi:hypothetical protein
MAAPPLPASLGKPVTSRQFSWKEMVVRQWGSEYAAPDHRVYVFSNGRAFDSTDLGTTGFYQRGFVPWDLSNGSVELDNNADTLAGGIGA